MAIRYRNYILVEYLIDNNVDIEIRNSIDQTPLHIATQYDLDITILLLDNGANLSAVDANGMSPLMTATEDHYEAMYNGATDKSFRNMYDMIQFLLGIGADIHHRDGCNQTVLHHAIGEPDVVQLLLDRGADISATDKGGATALIWASQTGRDDDIKILLNGGADVSVKDNRGSTALLWASKINRKDIVELLLDAGSDITAEDNHGNTVLLQACSNNCSKLVKLLLDQGSNIHHANQSGNTALHRASKYGYLEVVKLLLEYGADPTAVNGRGHMAEMMALERDNGDVALYLRDYRPLDLKEPEKS
jgi:ankyrin repeat protein